MTGVTLSTFQDNTRQIGEIYSVMLSKKLSFLEKSHWRRRIRHTGEKTYVFFWKVTLAKGGPSHWRGRVRHTGEGGSVTLANFRHLHQRLPPPLPRMWLKQRREEGNWPRLQKKEIILYFFCILSFYSRPKRRGQRAAVAAAKDDKPVQGSRSPYTERTTAEKRKH